MGGRSRTEYWLDEDDLDLADYPSLASNSSHPLLSAALCYKCYMSFPNYLEGSGQERNLEYYCGFL